MDYKVTWLKYKELAENAQRLRALGNISAGANTFDVMDLLYNTLLVALAQKGKPFSVELEEFMENPAEVDLSNRVLYMEDWVPTAARYGNPRARLIVAHEIAHMILHEGQVMAFSSEKAVRLNFLQEEESAERQAQDYALHLLLPDEVVIATRNIDAAAASIITSVEPQFIEERRTAFELHSRTHLGSYIDRTCECGATDIITLDSNPPCRACGNFF